MSRIYLQWQLIASGERAHVFTAFGFVHKITTFGRTAGFQALVQFSDAETATSAKDAIDGRSIPRYLILELGPCSLKVTYSAHTDLSVKFQSHRNRDYTNPLLPVAPSAIDANCQVSFLPLKFISFMFQTSVGLDGKKLEPESNVLLASIENMQYDVTLDVLHTVFSAFGPVLKIAVFDKNGGVQALIQYPDVQTTVVAKEALEGHSIYEGGFCKLHISYSRHTDLSIKVNNDRSRDYTIPNVPMMNAQPPMMNSQPSVMWLQPPSAGGPVVHPYNGPTQYAPAPQGFGAPQHSAAVWNSPVGSAPIQMPMQMHNHHYSMPASGPTQMGHGMMPMHGQNGLPHSGGMSPYPSTIALVTTPNF